MVQTAPSLERDIFPALVAWKDSPFRKPLILKGARQVGKTFALKEFGRRCFSNVAYFSLEKIDSRTPSEYAAFFEETKDPLRIVRNLSFASGQPIEPESTLIILDEIQDCPAALSSLKYFCEDAPEYRIACAGSLLGVALASEDSFPVGKVEFLSMYPLTFREFLQANGDANLVRYCNELDGFSPVAPLFENELQDQLRMYCAVGGMPEAVSRWVATHDMGQVDHVLGDLLASYERDFAKHGGGALYAKVSAVWRSLPAQLARENRKFLYGLVREGARAREYEDAIVWLANAGLVNKAVCCSKPGIPLAAYDEGKFFKLYCFDVGILRRLSGLDARAFARSSALFSEFKGAFAENYVLQSFVPQLDIAPRYWVNEKPQHEVDFVVQLRNDVVPVEVKSGQSVASPSLRYYARKYPDATPLRVRMSLQNIDYADGFLSLPLYLADWFSGLAERALRDCERVEGE